MSETPIKQDKIQSCIEIQDPLLLAGLDHPHPWTFALNYKARKPQILYVATKEVGSQISNGYHSDLQYIKSSEFNVPEGLTEGSAGKASGSQTSHLTSNFKDSSKVPSECLTKSILVQSIVNHGSSQN